jgi:alpha-galactosidase
MFGGELRDNDECLLSLLTNLEVLRVLNHSRLSKPLLQTGHCIVWTAEDEEQGKYVAVFNTEEQEKRVEIFLTELGISHACLVRDLWSREDIGVIHHSVMLDVPTHGARLLKLT